MPARSLCTLVTSWFMLATPIAAQPRISPQEVAQAKAGMSWDMGHSAKWHLDQQRRLSAALAGLKPQRAGVVDAYVLVAGLDADPVFAREAAETTKVLARRYDAAGRTVMLAAGNASAPDGSPPNLAAALAAIAERMDAREDVLILYATTHGLPQIGMVYKNEDKSYGMIAPERLAALLSELGIERRLVMISACFSGQFVEPLATPASAIVTASDSDRASFGCNPGNDWTYFGDALINTALRKPQPFAAAADAAIKLIGEWEYREGLTSSKPRLFVGQDAKVWLAALEARMPAGETARVGRPSVEGRD